MDFLHLKSPLSFVIHDSLIALVVDYSLSKASLAFCFASLDKSDDDSHVSFSTADFAPADWSCPLIDGLAARCLITQQECNT